MKTCFASGLHRLTTRMLSAALFGAFGLITFLAAEQATAVEQRSTGSGAGNASNPIVLANDILNRWEAIAVEAKAHSPAWREIFATQLTAMNVAVLGSIDAVKTDGADAQASYARFTQAVRAAEAQMFSIAKSEKGNPKLGSFTSDQVFVPIVPCRVVDTRNVGGPIAAGTTRNFLFYSTIAADDWSAQGGVPGPTGTTCPGTILPNGGTYAPSAAVVTITVVSPTAAGNWIVWGGANPIPTASALNWSAAGQVLANTTVIPEGGRSGSGSGGPIGDFAVRYNGATGSAHFVADVVGYLVASRATALDCYEAPVHAFDVTGIKGAFIEDAQGCAVGWTFVSANCDRDTFSFDLFVDSSTGASGTRAALCGFYHRDTGAGTIHASSVCCRVPGR